MTMAKVRKFASDLATIFMAAGATLRVLYKGSELTLSVHDYLWQEHDMDQLLVLPLSDLGELYVEGCDIDDEMEGKEADDPVVRGLCVFDLLLSMGLRERIGLPPIPARTDAEAVRAGAIEHARENVTDAGYAHSLRQAPSIRAH